MTRSSSRASDPVRPDSQLSDIAMAALPSTGSGSLAAFIPSQSVDDQSGDEDKGGGAREDEEGWWDDNSQGWPCDLSAEGPSSGRAGMIDDSESMVDHAMFLKEELEEEEEGDHFSSTARSLQQQSAGLPPATTTEANPRTTATTDSFPPPTLEY